MIEKLKTNKPFDRVPAINSFVARTTLTTGIHAVVVFSSIPGKKPTIAGKTITMFKGVIILCASLNVLA